MDDTTILAFSACVALAVLVWLMWKSATQAEWGTMSQSEKKKWRQEESERTGKGA